MPRMARIESPGSLFHIMAHSIEGKQLFIDDNDRLDFLSRFAKGLKKCEFQCYAWVLMDNHYHFLIRTSHLPLHKLMRPLNSGYAGRYNRKYKKRGYLFQDRFKSVLCQEQEYAATLIKYLHLNPLRAGKVKSFEELGAWAWSGHNFLLGKEGAKGEKFQNREQALRFFGETESSAISSYLKFLLGSCQTGNNEQAGQLSFIEATEISGSCKGWPAVIGDPEFAKKALENYKDYLNRKHRKAEYNVVLEEVARRVCETYSISLEELMKRGRKDKRSKARAEFCYQSHEQELIPLSVIARFLKTTIPPIAVLVKQGTPEVEEYCSA